MRLVRSNQFLLLLLIALIAGAWPIARADAQPSPIDAVCAFTPPDLRAPFAALPPDDRRREVREVQGGTRSFFRLDDRILAEMPTEALEDIRTAIRAAPRAGDLADGRVGPVTTNAVGLLCTVATVDVAAGDERLPTVLGAARHYNALAFDSEGRPTVGLYPTWPALVSDAGFEAFLRAGQVAGDHNLRVLRFAGPAPMVLRLFDEYVDAGGSVGPLGPANACASAAAILAGQTGQRGPAGLDEAAMRALLEALIGGPRDDLRAAYDAFCRRFPIRAPTGGLASALRDALEHFARLDAAVPEAIPTLAGARFTAWVLTDDGGRVAGERVRRLAGPASVVIPLLRDFPAQPSPPTELAECRQPTGWLYYELTDQAVERLEASDARAAAVEALAGMSFATREALIAAVDAAVGDSALDACSRARIRNVARRMSPVVNWALDEPSKDRLVAALPPGEPSLSAAFDVAPAADRERLARRMHRDLEALLAAQRVADTEELSGFALGFAVPVAAPEATDSEVTATDAPIEDADPNGAAEGEGEATEPVDTSAPETVLVIDETARATLAANGLPADALDRVLGRELPAEQLGATVREAVGVALVARDEPLTGQAFEASIRQALTRQEAFILTEAQVAELRAEVPALEGVPYPTSDLEQIADIAFPDPRLFADAVANARSPVADRGSPHAGSGFASVSPTTVDAATQSARPADAANTERSAPFAEAVGDCGCVRPLDQDTRVYAFYPFWTPPPASALQESRLDLRRISDVAFVGARIWGTETLAVASEPWEVPGAAASFVRTAHRHMAQADLAVRIADWATWSDRLTGEAARRIVELAEIRRLPARGLGEGIARTLTSGVDTLLGPFADLEPRLDGLTLHFENLGMPANEDDGSLDLAAEMRTIVALVEDVATLLREAVPDPALRPRINVAFTLPPVPGDGARRDAVERVFLGLAPILPVALTPAREVPSLETADTGDAAVEAARRRSPAEVVVGYVIVFLDRETRTTKQVLHAGIQAAFAGEDRQQVLRRTLAALPPNGHQDLFRLVPRLEDGAVVLRRPTPPEPFSQLRDDLVFFKDNFAGVAFWPPPLADQTGYAGMVATIDDVMVLSLDQITDALEWWSVRLAPICDVVCPNRVLARTVMAGLALAVLAMWITTRLYCRFCMEVAERYYFIPVLFVLLAVSALIVSICDPLLRQGALWGLAAVALFLAARVAILRLASRSEEQRP